MADHPGPNTEPPWDRTTGDNPVDSVDNASPESHSAIKKTPPPGDSDPRTSTESTDQQPRGADLARQALEAARAKAAARNTAAKYAKNSGAPRGAGRRRGNRRRWSGPNADDRDPQPLGRLAARIAVDRNWTRNLVGGQLFARWAELVGDDVAEHVTPERLEGTELIVRADSTAWATQLRLLQRQLLKRLAAGLGDGVVSVIKVAGPAAPSWRKGPRHIPGRGPRDTYG